jgi:predicted aconitase
MKLTQEEQDMLDGKKGPSLQKIMKTLVLYGQALGAERFANIEGDGHFSIPFAVPGVGARLEMLDELAEAGLKTKYPFTLDPRVPSDFENLDLKFEQKQVFTEMFRDQARYDNRMLELGLRDRNAYTCTPYLSEVGNIPERDSILAWSESSCVVYVNSILGARTNRNAAVIDILSNIAGKTPECNLLTDEGRRATWLIEVKTKRRPNPQLLGAAIGMKVYEDVPYIVGLNSFLGRELNKEVCDYLKEMGAACAAIGAVGLYHVEGLTPEAVEHGSHLLIPDYKTYVIGDKELSKLMVSYPLMWADSKARPEKCLIGCPHLSLRELYWWTNNIHEKLKAAGRKRVALCTIICAAPQVLEEFKKDESAFQKIRSAGVKLSATCIEMYMNNPLCAQEAVITNSNKLRTFTPARMLLDEELLDVLVSGEINEKRAI